MFSQRIAFPSQEVGWQEDQPETATCCHEACRWLSPEEANHLPTVPMRPEPLRGRCLHHQRRQTPFVCDTIVISDSSQTSGTTACSAICLSPGAKDAGGSGTGPRSDV